ncbi:hypothetical protein AA100600_0864 [Gluconobacter thailandicus F149-1 = NBRC 100600]|nr:hypothetical protein AA100600_0864 [Gluconobacter thailandicus F149-1 = NBRC 100600]
MIVTGILRPTPEMDWDIMKVPVRQKEMLANGQGSYQKETQAASMA